MADEPDIHDAESLDDLFSGLDVRETGYKPGKPFKFLDPFGPEDREIFFGREIETAEAYSRFYKSRLLIIYGESGTGKTSLIQCGLRSEIPPEDAVFFTIRSANDPLEVLKKEILKQTAFPDGEAPGEAIDLLREAAFLKSKPLVLVFDQFEQFFIFQPESVRENFVRELASWLDADINIRVILCIREEYLARLSELEAWLPQLYHNRMWVRRMSREQAREAIAGPCRKCGVEIEKNLSEELLADLSRGGRGGQGVGLPHLQVVLDSLYNKAVETSPGSPVLTLSAYQELGKIDSILRRFIEDKVSGHDKPDQVRQVLKAMVMAEGTRRTGSRQEILENAANFGDAISEEELTPLLKSLIDDRIVREDVDKQHFELLHDTLAQTIRQWMTGIEQELMEVRQTIQNRLKEYQARRTLLDASTLEYIAPYESRLALKGDLAELVDKSREEAARRREEAARRRRRMLTYLGAAACVFLAVVSALATFGYYRAAQKENYRGIVLNENGQKAMEAGNFNAARLYSLYALLKLPPTGAWGAQARGVLLGAPEYRIAFTSAEDRSPILAVAFSPAPDARIVATASDDGTVRLWDAATGKLLMTLEGHSKPVNSVAFSPDGKILASASRDETEGIVRLWDAANGKLLRTLRHFGEVWGVAFSPDGKTLASGSVDKTVRLWDVKTGTEKTKLRGPDLFYGVAFSPDGKTLAAGSNDRTVHIWDVNEEMNQGIERKPLSGHLSQIYSVSFSPDGRRLASGSWDNSVRIWDMESEKEPQVLWGHMLPVTAVCFSPDGRILASASNDKTIRLWDTKTGKELATLPGHMDTVRGIAFSPDGRTLASVSDDKTMRLWDVPTEKDCGILSRCASAMWCAVFSPDGKTLASSGADPTIHLWDTKTGKERRALPGHELWVHGLNFSPDGRTLASGSDDNTIRLWDVKTGDYKKIRMEHMGRRDRVFGVAFSPDGKTLASTSPGRNAIRLWDVETLEQKAMVRGQGGVYCVTFSPDGRSLASGGSTLILWGQWGPRCLLHSWHYGFVQSVDFSPDGKVLASGGRDNTIHIWDVVTGKEKATLRGHASYVYGVRFSPDGKTLASASWDHTVRLWDPQTGKQTAILTGHTAVCLGRCLFP